MKTGLGTLLLVLAVCAATVMVLAAVGRGDAPAAGVHDANRSARASEKELSASAVLAIDVAKSSAPLKSRSASAAPTLSQELGRARFLKPLYERLTAPGGSPSAEAKFVLYEILAGCAMRSDAPAGLNRRKTLEARRKSLAESIPDSSPSKQRRLALFDEMMLDRCDGLETLTTTRAELDRLLNEAAREGDGKARAEVVALEIQNQMAGPTPGSARGLESGPAIGDAQLQTLRESIMSRDPEAIVTAGTVLSNTFRDVVVEVGPNREPLDGRAAMEAWRLLACEYGAECGAANRQVQSACIFSGQCNATTLPDLVFFYGTTPYQSQLVDSYRAIFRQAVEGGDWSQLRFVRRPNSGNFWYHFGPSRGN
jgi:hypothetical protein